MSLLETDPTVAWALARGRLEGFQLAREDASAEEPQGPDLVHWRFYALLLAGLLYVRTHDAECFVSEGHHSEACLDLKAALKRFAALFEGQE